MRASGGPSDLRGTGKEWVVLLQCGEFRNFHKSIGHGCRQRDCEARFWDCRGRSACESGINLERT